MKNLKHLLTQPFLAIPTKLIIVGLIVALLGFADAMYLTIEHYLGAIPPCSIGGCEKVLTSEYSTVFGVPVALGGVIYYLIMLVGVFGYIESKNEKLLRWTLLFTVFGFVSSLYFFYIQAFVLKAFCLYCLGSTITSTLLFVLAIYIFSKYSQD